MNRYVDIIVTYNRKKLLNENIKALIEQTFKEHDILIIDNASTDGTDEMVKSLSLNNQRIKYYNTNKNLGGAGGFAFGLEVAIKNGYEFAWIMDDDSIPEKNALESLIKKGNDIDNKFSFLASLVYWTDNQLFNMNIPEYNYKKKMDIQFELIRDYKLVPIETCSFVGCFIKLQCAEKVGLPISEFFIYGDDVEYTSRLKKIAPAFLDLDSTIIHKAPSNKGADIVTAEKERIERFYYQSRNGMYIAKKNKAVFKRIKTVLKRFIRDFKKFQGL